MGNDHITADKREIKDFPKLSYFDWTQYKSATSFIRKPLSAIAGNNNKNKSRKKYEKK
jgi:hypothetical protein